jgi:hypothetical protein
VTKVIDVPDDGDVGTAFEAFCERYDIAVMDRAKIYEIFVESGPGYALQSWRGMQRNCQ